MREPWNVTLGRWTDAGLIDADGVERIRAFEAAHTRSAGLSWPVRLAVAFGGLMLGAGVLLFVSANWDAMSPAARFSVLLAAIGCVHTIGAAASQRSPIVA